MRDNKRWIRWSIQFYIFFLCFHVGLMITYQAMLWEMESFLEEHTPETTVVCGKFNNDKSLWDASGFIQNEEGLTQFLSEKADSGLHIVALNSAEKTSSVKPIVINVSGDKVKTLVLVSRQSVGWDIQAAVPESIKTIVTITPDHIWIKEKPETAKLEYLGPEKVCVHAWQAGELANPENQFRRMIMAIREHTKTIETSFQGKEYGDSFEVPPRPLTNVNPQRNVASILDTPKTGLIWKRKKMKLVADSYKYQDKFGEWKNHRVPEDTQQVVVNEAGDLFMIKKFRLGVWSKKEKVFTPINMPVVLQEIYWPSALAWDKRSNTLYVFNDDRGGELYALKEGKWSRLGAGYPFSVAALTLDTKNNELLAVTRRGNKINAVHKIDLSGKLVKTEKLRAPLDYHSQKWRSMAYLAESQLYFQVSHLAQPGGDSYQLLW